MLLIHTALNCEAKPFIKHFALKKVSNAPFPLFKNDAIALIISGSGAVRTSVAIGYLGGLFYNNHPISFLNVGITGHSTYPIGSLFLGHKISVDSDTKCFYPPLLCRETMNTEAIHTVSAVETAYTLPTLYDMEAAHFFTSALKFATIECIQTLKCVSDNRETPFSTVTDTQVTLMIEGLLPEMLPTIEKLHSFTQDDHVQPILDMYTPYLKRWHFTETQRQQLKKTLTSYYYLKKEPSKDIEVCRNGQEVINQLKAALKTTPHVLSPIH